MRRLVAVIAAASALVAAGPAAAADLFAPELLEDGPEQTTVIGPNVGGGEYTLDVELSGPGADTFTVRRVNEPLEFHWTCKRVGSWQWAATVTYADGNVATSGGDFTVPGPCRQTRNVRMLRTTVLRYASRELAADRIVVDRFCQRRSPADRSGRARRWYCGVSWLTDGGKVCGAGYDIRRRQELEYGTPVLSEWVTSRRTRFICA